MGRVLRAKWTPHISSDDAWSLTTARLIGSGELGVLPRNSHEMNVGCVEQVV